jgi:hypothetical protein
MTVVEDRLARDIEAVTRDIVLTESDLVIARAAVSQRVDSRRQRDRRRTALAVAAAALLIPAVGIVGWQSFDDTQGAPPANPAPTAPIDSDEAFLSGSIPTPQSVEGIWETEGHDLLMRFTPDGGIHIDNRGGLLSGPSITGRYEIADDLIAITFLSQGCGGTGFTARASHPQADALHMITEQGSRAVPCDTYWGDRWSFRQVLPSSAEQAELAPLRGGDFWAPPTGRYLLEGIWWTHGDGHLVELAPNGSYAVVDEALEVVDRGSWSLREPFTRLVLASAAGSPRCSEGDRFVIGDVERYLGVVRSMRGTVDQNDCGGAWGSGEWLRLAPGIR